MLLYLQFLSWFSYVSDIEIVKDIYANMSRYFKYQKRGKLTVTYKDVKPSPNDSVRADVRREGRASND